MLLVPESHIACKLIINGQLNQCGLIFIVAVDPESDVPYPQDRVEFLSALSKSGIAPEDVTDLEVEYEEDINAAFDFSGLGFVNVWRLRVQRLHNLAGHLAEMMKLEKIDVIAEELGSTFVLGQHSPHIRLCNIEVNTKAKQFYADISSGQLELYFYGRYHTPIHYIRCNGGYARANIIHNIGGPNNCFVCDVLIGEGTPIRLAGTPPVVYKTIEKYEEEHALIFDEALNHFLDGLINAA